MGLNQFRIGQRVAVAARPDMQRIVHAVQRVQAAYYYELGGLHEYLIREDALIALESRDAVGFVPCPMAQVEK